MGISVHHFSSIRLILCLSTAVVFFTLSFIGFVYNFTKRISHRANAKKETRWKRSTFLFIYYSLCKVKALRNRKRMKANIICIFSWLFNLLLVLIYISIMFNYQIIISHIYTLSCLDNWKWKLKFVIATWWLHPFLFFLILCFLTHSQSLKKNEKKRKQKECIVSELCLKKPPTSYY